MTSANVKRSQAAVSTTDAAARVAALRTLGAPDGSSRRPTPRGQIAKRAAEVGMRPRAERSVAAGDGVVEQ
jgi:hypothetical protein